MTTNQLEKKRMTAIPMMEVRQMEIQVNLLLESQVSTVQTQTYILLTISRANYSSLSYHDKMDP